MAMEKEFTQDRYGEFIEMEKNKKYKEVRIITAESLRQLCMKNNWYTRGYCRDYEHLLYDLADSKKNVTTDDIVAMAVDIMEHSEPGEMVSSICMEIASIACTFFEEVKE